MSGWGWAASGCAMRPAVAQQSGAMGRHPIIGRPMSTSDGGFGQVSGRGRRKKLGFPSIASPAAALPWPFLGPFLTLAWPLLGPDMRLLCPLCALFCALCALFAFCWRPRSASDMRLAKGFFRLFLPRCCCCKPAPRPGRAPARAAAGQGHKQPPVSTMGHGRLPVSLQRGGWDSNPIGGAACA